MSSNSLTYTRDTINYSTSDYLLMLGIALGFSIPLVVISIFCQNTCCRRRNGGVATRTAFELRHDCGLSPSAVATLPTFGYRRDIGSKSDGCGWAQCAVCLNLVHEEEMVRQLPKCKHLFHIECIDLWLYSHSTCPLCRATVQPIEPDEPLPPV